MAAGSRPLCGEAGGGQKENLDTKQSDEREWSSVGWVLVHCLPGIPLSLKICKSLSHSPQKSEEMNPSDVVAVD